MVPEQGLDALNTAVAKLAADCTDPKVALNVQYTYAAGVLSATAIIFYDAPTQPAGIFDGLLSVPGSSVNVSTTDFLSFISSVVPSFGGNRIDFGDAPVEAYSPTLLSAIVNETSVSFRSYMRVSHETSL